MGRGVTEFCSFVVSRIETEAKCYTERCIQLNAAIVDSAKEQLQPVRSRGTSKHPFLRVFSVLCLVGRWGG